MKYLTILLSMAFISCSTSNKIAVRYNKYSPVHLEKYTVKNGRYYVRGREVRLIPGTQVYGAK